MIVVRRKWFGMERERVNQISQSVVESVVVLIDLLKLCFSKVHRTPDFITNLNSRPFTAADRCYTDKQAATHIVGVSSQT